MNVRDVMTSNPRTVSPGDSIQVAARIMREEDTGVVPIVENGKTVGIITDLVFVKPDASTKDAEKLMSERQIRRLPVVEGDRLVGIISLGDIAVKEGRDSRTGDTLESISE